MQIQVTTKIFARQTLYLGFFVLIFVKKWSCEVIGNESFNKEGRRYFLKSVYESLVSNFGA